MPRKAIDYSKSIIYTIRCLEDPKLLYVGSTTSFVDRKKQHKQKCKKETTKLYNMIRENGGWDNFVMIEHSNFTCNNSTELRQEEERVRLDLQTNLNSNKCFMTKEETKKYISDYNKQYDKEHIEERKQRVNENKEHIAEVQKKWVNENKEHIAEVRKKWVNENKEHIAEVRKKYKEDNREYIAEVNKKYKEDNREYIAEVNKQYNIDNKDKINKRRRDLRAKKKLVKP